MRWENAAFISPANSSVIREKEQWREGGGKKARGLERRGDRHEREGVVEVVCSFGVKQTELEPCGKKKKMRQIKKSDGRHWFFFHHHLSVLSLLLPLLKAQQSERPPETATTLQATFYLYPVVLFLRCSPSCFFFVPIYHNFCTILYSFPGTSTLVICGFSPPYYRDMIALTLLSDYSRWRVKVLFSRPFSCDLWWWK